MGRDCPHMQLPGVLRLGGKKKKRDSLRGKKKRADAQVIFYLSRISEKERKGVLKKKGYPKKKEDHGRHAFPPSSGLDLLKKKGGEGWGKGRCCRHVFVASSEGERATRRRKRPAAVVFTTRRARKGKKSEAGLAFRTGRRERREREM